MARRRSKPSHTAAKVARGVAYLARDPLHATLLPEGAADSIERLALAAGALKPWMIRLFERRWYRSLVETFVDWLAPGELMRLTLRKRFVDDEVRAAVEGGARQVLIVGAGLDTLGMRISASFADIPVLEVDTPGTIRMRREAAETTGSTAENHHLVALDLSSTPLDDVLARTPAWSDELPSVVVAEGVLMYLSEAEVRALLDQIREATFGCRLVFSYLYADERGRPMIGRASWLSRLVLGWLGEPLRWGVRSDDDLVRLLSASGFRLLEPGQRGDLNARYLAPRGIDRPVGQVERVAVAEASRTPRMEVPAPSDDLPAVAPDPSVSTLTVPVVVDAIRSFDGTAMARCTHFVVASTDVGSAWQVELESARIPALAVGISAAIYAPLEGGSIFGDADSIDDMYTVIEANDHLTVEMSDSWLPLSAFDLPADERRPQRGDVYRVPYLLFDLSRRFAAERLSRGDFLDRIAGAGERARPSPPETAAFRSWSLRQIEEARSIYPKNPHLELGYDHSGSEADE